MIRKGAAALLTAATLSGSLAGCGGTSPAAQSTTPAATPAATSTAQAQSASAAVLAARLRAAGLGVTHLIVYNASTDPNHLLGRQGGYTSKVVWVDPAAISAGAGSPADDPGGTEYGGGIEVFPDATAAMSRYQYLKGFTAPLGDGYDFIAGTAVLRLSSFLTPVQARRYEAEFKRIA